MHVATSDRDHWYGVLSALLQL